MLYNEKDKLLAFNIEFKDLIAKGKVSEAIGYTIKMIDKKSIIYDQFIAISESFQRVNHQQSVLSHSDFIIEMNKITEKLMKVANDIRDHDLTVGFNFQEINTINKAISIIKSTNQEKRELEENLLKVNEILNIERSDHQLFVNQFKKENDALKEEIEHIEIELLKCKEEETRTKIANDELNDQISSYEINLNELKLSENKLRKEVDQKEIKLNEHEGEKKDISKAYDNLNHNYIRIKDTYLRAKNTINQLKDENQSLKEDIKGLDKYDHLTANEKLRQENFSLKKALQESKTKLEEALDESETHKKNKILEDEKNKLNTNIEKLNKEIEQQNRKIISMQDNLTNSNGKLASCERNLDRLKIARESYVFYLKKSDEEILQEYFKEKMGYSSLCKKCRGRGIKTIKIPLYFFFIIFKTNCKKCKGLGTDSALG